MKNKIVLLIIIVFLAKPDLYSESEKTLAIFSFKANNTPASFEIILKDMFEVALYKTKYFKILERAQINMILQEHGLEMGGCTDQSCAVEFGKILSADLAAYGSISKFDKYSINFKVINIHNSELVFTDTIEAAGEKDFQRVAEIISEKIILSIQNKDKGSYKNRDYYYRGFVPGWAQIYTGNNVKGSLLAGGFIFSGISSIGTWYYYDKKNDDYHKIKSGYKKSVYDKAYDKYYNSGVMFYSSLGVFSLIYIINWIDLIYFNEEMPVKLGVSSDFNDKNISQNPGSKKIDGDIYKNNGMFISFSRKF